MIAGAGFGSRLPGISTQPGQDTVLVPEIQTKAIPTNPCSERLRYLLRDFFQKAVQIVQWEVCFPTSVQDQTTYSYVSSFAQGVPELLSAGF